MRLRVIAFLMFTTAVFTLFSQEDDDWYMGKPIKSISFTGLKNIALSELEALIQQYTGTKFDEVIFWDIQSKLYALEYFDRIEPSVNPANTEGSEVILVFNVVERPVISRINFSGNSNLRNRELQDTISSKVSDILNQVKVRNDVSAIVGKYLEKGYPNVTVNVEETQARDGSTILTFRINEMERISISRIDFEGNSKFSASTLKSQLSLKAKSLINDGNFQEAKLILDRETLAKYYHDRGYINAVVRDVTRTYESDDKGGTKLILTFMIEEGSEFKFGGITFEGNSIFTTEQLQKLITSKSGDVVNITKIESDFQAINDIYFEGGYIFNSINRTPELDPQTNVLSFTISIIERNRAYIESITVRGNEKTKTDVILREIPMEPGDVFSRTKIMDALRNLYNLQYFTAIIPDTLPGSAENLMDLVFTVEEQMTTDLQIGLTFSGNSDPDALPVSGLFEFKDRNLAGSGNELGIKLNSSIVDSTTLAVNYLHRWVMGLPLSLGIDLTADFIRRQTQMANQNWWFNGDETNAFPDGYNSFSGYEGNNKILPNEYLMKYDEWYLSLGFSSGYRWTTLYGNLSLSGGIRFGLLNNNYDEIYRPFDPVLRAGNNQWTPKNSVWTSLSLDQRDIYYDPSNGYFLMERLGLYGFFGSELEHYIRSDTKAQYFLTLFNIPITRNWNFKSILAVHAGLSFIFGQPGRGDLKVSKSNQLAVDGMFTGRGWGDKYSEKGYSLLDGWVELRFPIVQNILAFDLFFDTAGIEVGDENFFKNNLLYSFGGSLRLTMPQFPIRLGIAKRFKFNNGEFQWEPGSLFGDPNNPAKGVDIIFSFVISY